MQTPRQCLHWSIYLKFSLKLEYVMSFEISIIFFSSYFPFLLNCVFWLKSPEVRDFHIILHTSDSVCNLFYRLFFSTRHAKQDSSGLNYFKVERWRYRFCFHLLCYELLLLSLSNAHTHTHTPPSRFASQYYKVSYHKWQNMAKKEIKCAAEKEEDCLKINI